MNDKQNNLEKIKTLLLQPGNRPERSQELIQLLGGTSYVRFQYGGLSNDAWDDFCFAMKENTSVTTLEVISTQVDENAALCLKSILECHPALASMRLMENAISDENLKCVFEGLEKNIVPFKMPDIRLSKPRENTAILGASFMAVDSIMTDKFPYKIR